MKRMYRLMTLLMDVVKTCTWYLSGSALTAENLTAVVKATGNDVPAYYPTLFAAYLEKSEGCEKFCKLGGGGKYYRFLFFVRWNVAVDFDPLSVVPLGAKV